MWRARVIVAFWLLLITLFPSSAQAPERSASNNYSAGSWETFSSLPAAQAELTPEKFDTNLLSAAVLHATNAERNKHQLAPLRHHPGAERAAALQAEIMRGRGSISHDNPSHPKLQTLEDRVRAVGLKYRFIAENVATAFALRYESGRAFYPRTVDSKTIVSYTPDGPPIPPHSYASFAQALVQNWMNSPGHRKNILSTNASYLGASCLPEPNPTVVRKFYCAQVFFTPTPGK